MCHCDLLISDYSGTIVDYLITKNQSYFMHRFKEFQKKTKLFFDYDKFNFCHKTTKYDLLIKLIKKYLSNDQKFSQKFAFQRKKWKNYSLKTMFILMKF